MRKLKFFAVAALAIFAMACTKTEQEADKISLSKSQIVVGMNAGQATLTFNANKDWTVTSNAEWLTFAEANGKAGNAEIAIEYSKNDTWETRTGEITIKAGEAEATYTVEQKAGNYFGATGEIVLTFEEQEFGIEVTTNADYDVTIEYPAGTEAWISQMDGKAAPEEEYITFLASANLLTSVRYATITVGNEDAAIVYDVIQSYPYNMTLEGAGWLSSRQNPYDTNNYYPSTFGQYGLSFTCDGNIVALVLNVDKASADPATLPTGTFTCDAAADHSANTFSIKPIATVEPAYTTIINEESGAETLVFDGEIKIVKKDGLYRIDATLMDENGKINEFSWEGENPEIENAGFGTKAYYDYRADYDTYFTTKATAWNVSMYISEPAVEGGEWVYSLGFNLFGSEGISDIDGFEEGTYTFAEPESAGTGKKNAEPFTFENTGGYANYFYDPETGDVTYDYADIIGGTIEISNKDGNIYNVKANLRIQLYNYDENWEPENVREIDYSFNDEDDIFEASDSGMRPLPDADHEFKALGFNPQYMGMWLGKGKVTANANVVYIEWSYVDNNYTIDLETNITGWEFEKNYASRYCNTPIPDGKYEFSYTRADNTLPNLKKPANYRCSITNGYTGTKTYVREGYIEIEDGNITFDLYAAPFADEQYGDSYHFTGTLGCSLSYIRDVSTTTVEFNDDEDPTFKKHLTVTVGDAGAAMQFNTPDYIKFPAHAFTSVGDLENYVEIVQEGVSYYIDGVDEIPAVSSINGISVVTATDAAAEDYSIPCSGITGNMFVWITDDGGWLKDPKTISAGTVMEFESSWDWTGETANVTSNLVKGTKYASILYDRTGSSAKWKVLEVSTSKPE